MLKHINIVDTGADRYTLEIETNILGRMYDNNAESIIVTKPENELENGCTMIVTANDEVIDHIVVGTEPIYITSNLSQYSHVSIGFCFTNETGYIKNSEVKTFKFLYAQKPDDFTPVPPEVTTQITTLLGGAFLSSSYDSEHKLLKFFNLAGDLVSSVDATQFAGETNYDELENRPSINSVTLTGNKTSSDLGLQPAGDYATNTRVNSVEAEIPTQTSQLTNNSGFITNQVNDLANYTKTADLGDLATKDTVDYTTDVTNKPTLGTLAAKDTVDYATEVTNKPSIPENTSDLNNDSGFIDNTVNDLTNYYLKTETYTQTEVNTLLAAIKTIKAEIVTNLPTASADTYFNTSKTIYMVRNQSQSGEDYYDEYITVRTGEVGSYTYSWEHIGSTQIDLSGYVQKTFTIAGVDMQDNITKAELRTALDIPTDLSAKMDKNNPTGSGSFSLNRAANTTIGNKSVAIGNNTQATGTVSYAEGSSTIAVGEASHAEGQYNGTYINVIISGDANAVEYTLQDIMSEIDKGKVIIYNNKYAKILSVDNENLKITLDKTLSSGTALVNEAAIIRSSIAYGDASHSESYNNTASGQASHAEGNNTLSMGQGSHSEGMFTSAIGQASHSEGYSTRTEGESSHAEGSNTWASGDYSHSEGYNTTANGQYSHVEGLGNTANGKSQHVFGEYNIEENVESQSQRGTYVEIVGNGAASDNRSNARTLDWSGNEVLSGSSTASSFIKTNGTSSEFLKADGSVDSNVYENTANKSSTISSSSLSSDYPTSQAVYNYVNSKRQIYHTYMTSQFSYTEIYPDYPYSATIGIMGTTAQDIAYVMFDYNQIMSGNFAPICDTNTDTVTVYSKVDPNPGDGILIPTIIVLKEDASPTPPVVTAYTLLTYMNSTKYSYTLYLKDTVNLTREFINPTTTDYSYGMQSYSLQETQTNYAYEYEVTDNDSHTTVATNTFIVDSQMIGTTDTYRYPTETTTCTITITNAPYSYISVYYKNSDYSEGPQLTIDTSSQSSATFILPLGDYYYNVYADGYQSLYHENLTVDSTDTTLGTKSVSVTLQPQQSYYYFSVSMNFDAYDFALYLHDTVNDTSELVYPSYQDPEYADWSYELPLNETGYEYVYEVTDPSDSSLLYSDSFVVDSVDTGTMFYYPTSTIQYTFIHPFVEDWTDPNNPEFPRLEISYNNNGTKGLKIMGGAGDLNEDRQIASSLMELPQGSYYYDFSCPTYQSITNGTFTVGQNEMSQGYGLTTIYEDCCKTTINITYSANYTFNLYTDASCQMEYQYGVGRLLLSSDLTTYNTELWALPEGTYYYEVSADGFVSQTGNMTITAQDVTTGTKSVSITLTPQGV